MLLGAFHLTCLLSRHNSSLTAQGFHLAIQGVPSYFFYTNLARAVALPSSPRRLLNRSLTFLPVVWLVCAGFSSISAQLCALLWENDETFPALASACALGCIDRCLQHYVSTQRRACPVNNIYKWENDEIFPALVLAHAYSEDILCTDRCLQHYISTQRRAFPVNNIYKLQSRSLCKATQYRLPPTVILDSEWLHNSPGYSIVVPLCIFVLVGGQLMYFNKHIVM